MNPHLSVGFTGIRFDRIALFSVFSDSLSLSALTLPLLWATPANVGKSAGGRSCTCTVGPVALGLG